MGKRKEMENMMTHIRYNTLKPLAAANAWLNGSPIAVTANETAPIARQISPPRLDLARTAHPGFIIVALLYR